MKPEPIDDSSENHLLQAGQEAGTSAPYVALQSSTRTRQRLTFFHANTWRSEGRQCARDRACEAFAAFETGGWPCMASLRTVCAWG